MNKLKFRHEYKYMITSGQAEILKRRADAIMERDSHICTDGKYAGLYNIRSVYFDDIYNSAYYENENGIDPREKFRIRIYNHSDSRIVLELKKKQSGKCLKQSCTLTRSQCDILISGGSFPVENGQDTLLQKFLLQINTRKLHPVVVVEYDRIPYIYPMGNVRVTIDCNIRASNECDRFFAEDLPLRPILPTGRHILEVKWDELLPDFIYRSMMLDNLQWSGFSKFYLGRRYTNKFI